MATSIDQAPESVVLDRQDVAILQMLQSNGRATNLEISRRVNMSESACMRRMRALEAQGVITGYVAIVDSEKVGRGLNVFLTITLTTQAQASLLAFESAAADVREIMECYLMTGSADYLVRVVVRNVKSFEKLHAEVLTRLPGILRITSSIALRAAVRRHALPL